MPDGTTFPPTLAQIERREITCAYRDEKTAADLATVKAIEEMFRASLLDALSKAREMSIEMEPRYRKQLMADLGECFHPDEAASDLFADGFYNTTRAIEADMEG